MRICMATSQKQYTVSHIWYGVQLIHIEPIYGPNLKGVHLPTSIQQEVVVGLLMRRIQCISLLWAVYVHHW